MTAGTRPKNKNGRLFWLAMMVCVLLGLSGGLVLTWEVWPVEYFDTDPADLRAELKQEYLLLTSLSFAATDDWEQAHQRLEWLGFEEESASRTLVSLTKRYAELGVDVISIRSLSKLAYALGARDSQVLVFVVTPTSTVTSTPAPTATPTVTSTPTHTPLIPTLPATATPSSERDVPPGESLITVTSTHTATPTALPLPLYEVTDKFFSCRTVEQAEETGLAEVQVEGPDGEPRAGVALSMVWDDKEDLFFTGLKPDHGRGYADFEMQSGQEYVLVVDGPQSEPVVISFRDEDCAAGSSEQRRPIWQVVFKAREGF